MSMSTHLYRSRDDRMLAGVAGGLAELWDADPSLVRILWAVLVVLTGGIALVVYIVMAIVVPEEDAARAWGSALNWTPPTAPAPGAPAALVAPASADPTIVPPAQPAAAAAADWPASRFEARESRRDARRAARDARRANRRHDGRSGAIVVGVLFILVGAWYLVREFLPTIDWDWFWPLVLVAVGVLVLVLAVRPRDDSGTPGTHEGGRS
jgi:phage shock protein C